MKKLVLAILVASFAGPALAWDTTGIPYESRVFHENLNIKTDRQQRQIDQILANQEELLWLHEQAEYERYIDQLKDY